LLVPQDSSARAILVDRLLCLGRLSGFVPTTSPVDSIFLAATVDVPIFHLDSCSDAAKIAIYLPQHQGVRRTLKSMSTRSPQNKGSHARRNNETN
jgi:hypothetical protein